jgi:hypothetical protein
MATKSEKTLDDLFLETLKDIYYAERKILKALPKMARGAEDAKLKAAFEKHRDQTEEHVARLQQVFELLGKPARGKTCPAIDGIIEEGEEIMEDFKGTAALDAGRGALRDDALRHAKALGRAARHGGCRQAVRRHAEGGVADGLGPHQAGRRFGQHEGGRQVQGRLTRQTALRILVSEGESVLPAERIRLPHVPDPPGRARDASRGPVQHPTSAAGP